jgi:outer membrane receptor protein involved in Fe transport
MRNRKWIGLLLCCLLVLMCNAAFGQATASSGIQGTIVDKSQAAITGAEVTATNKATGAVRTTKTNDMGAYRFDLLPAGVYAIKATAQGFSAAEAKEVELLVGSTTTQNLTLAAGAVSETVEVTGVAPLIDQTKTDVSQNITPAQVAELPIAGRDVANLAYLAPGVRAADSYDPTKARYAILSVNGQGGRNVNVTVNGVDNKDNTVGGPVMQLPLEAVQEFAISTQRFSAANGRSEGAAINMVTKSGSNNYHGSLFGFFRDQTFNADQHPTPDQTTNPPYTRQQFGGSVGGPFVKEKLFGFFAYERQREHTSLSESADTLAQLQLVTSLGAQPAAVIPTPFFETRYHGRADYRINEKHSAYLSYTSQANNSLNDQADGFQDLTAGNFTDNHLQLANLSLTSMLSNTMANTFTTGFQYWNNVINTNTRAPLFTFPSGGSANCGPGGSCFGTNANVPQQSYQRKYQFRDDLTKTWGNHTFKTGADYIWNPILGGYFEFNSTLEIDFADDPKNLTDPTKWAQGFATPGAISGMTIANGDPSTNVKGGTKQFGVYFQDDWKMSRRLTVNLGLRWDKDFNMIGTSQMSQSRTVQEMQAIAPISPLAARFINKLPSDDNKDFSPRVGFAYDLTGRGNHVLRGGFGLYYGNVFQNIPLFLEQQANPTIFQTLFSITASDIVPGTGIPLDQWRFGKDPLPTIAPPSSQLTPGSTGRIMDPNYRNPMTEEFNGGYSWSLNPSSVVEVDYIHVLSLHENKTININPNLPINGNPTQGFARQLSAAFAAKGVPVLASVRDEQSIGRSRYDGLNLSFRQRMAHRFSLNANYTLSRAMSYDGGTSSFRNYPRDPRFPFSKFEFGPTANDERHHVTISGVTDLPWGIQFAPILQFGSARPYNLLPSYDTLSFGSGDTRAVVVPNSDPTNYTLYAKSSTAGAARTCYFSGQCHLAPYDPVRGDAFFQLDTRLSKNIHLGEQRNLQLIFQAFNLTNRANYGNDFDGTISSSTFRQPAGFINPTSTTTPRSFTGEFGFRFSF